MSALGLIAVLAMVVLSLAYVINLRGKALAHATQETVSLSRIIAEQTTRAFQGADLVLLGVQERLKEVEQRGIRFDDYPVHILLKSRLAGMQHIDSFFIVDASGTVINSSRSYPITAISLADRAYFTHHQNSRDKDVHVSVPVVSRPDGKWTIHISRRITRADGSFGGVIAAALSLNYFEQLYASVKLDYVSPISLFLSDGHLVAREPHDETMIGKIEKLPARSGAPGAEHLGKAVIDGPQAATIIYRDVSGFPLTIGISTPEHAALATWRENSIQLLFGTLMAIVLVTLITALLVRELIREKKLAADLSDTGETLQALVNAAMDAIVTIDSHQVIVLFNPAAEIMFGCAASEAIGLPLERFMPKHARDAHSGHLAEYRRSGSGSRMASPQREITGLHSDGREFPIEATISKVSVGGQTLLTAILRDISDRRHSEQVMLASHAQLRELSDSLITVREAEQTRIARELHDELGQQLMRLRLDLSWLAGRLKDGQPELLSKVQDMKGMIAETVTSVRRITTELRPPLLDDLGFSAAAGWLVDDFSKRTGIEITTAIETIDALCDAHTASNLFRILQEALTNIVRHAQATRTWVNLRLADGFLLLTIQDNGKGLVRVDGDVRPIQGNGLVGIRERVLMLGGTVEIAGQPGQGTTISISVPFKSSATAEGETK